MLPVFINRCGAGRHVELIPSDYSSYAEPPHGIKRVAAWGSVSRFRITKAYRTRKGTLLLSVLLGITTSTVPVVAPVGTVVVM
jgi:hypothetical protein